MDTERSLTTPVDPRIRMQKEGLYDPSFEHASCGVGFVVNVDGRRTHQIVSHGITILKNLVHRGAVGGDSRLGFSLPAKGPESFLVDAADEEGGGGRPGDIGLEDAYALKGY
jgi:glutamate synthase domain-containing protein 1